MKYQRITSIGQVDENYLADGLKSLLKQHPEIWGMKCVRHGEPIAQAVFSFSEDQEGISKLESIFVPTKYRRLKLGRDIMRKAEASLADSAISQVTAEVFGEDEDASAGFLAGIGFTGEEEENEIVRCRLSELADASFLDEKSDDDILQFDDRQDRNLAIVCSMLAEKQYYIERRQIDLEFSFFYIRDNEVVGAMFGHHSGSDALMIDKCFFDGIDPSEGISILLGYEIYNAKENLDEDALITVCFDKKEYNEVAHQCFGQSCEVIRVRKFVKSIGEGGNQ